MRGWIASIRPIRSLVGVLCVLGQLTPVAVWAQQEEANVANPEARSMTPVYQDLELREEAEAHRRLEILRMRGEAARLTANTEELAAQAQNCKARREAYLAGAQVTLCPNDELALEIRDVSIESGPMTQNAQLLLDRIEDRMLSLEKKLIENPEFTSPEPLGPLSAAAQGLGTSQAVLLLAGPARAIVRLSAGEGDVVYRLPFEARKDGSDCIRTVTALHGIGIGTRICRADSEL